MALAATQESLPIDGKAARINPRRLVFCKEFAKIGNATKAALKAGYAEGHAASIGCRLVKNPSIQAVISRFRQQAIEASSVDNTAVLARSERIAAKYEARDDVQAGELALKATETQAKLIGMLGSGANPSAVNALQVQGDVNIGLDPRSVAELIASMLGGAGVDRLAAAVTVQAQSVEIVEDK